MGGTIPPLPHILSMCEEDSSTFPLYHGNLSHAISDSTDLFLGLKAADVSETAATYFQTDFSLLN
jgi:hypothetical protein